MHDVIYYDCGCEKNINLPKRAYTRPSILSIAVFIILMSFLASFLNGWLFVFLFTFLAPLQILNMVVAYFAGLSLSKIICKKWHKNLLVVFLIMVTIQVSWVFFAMASVAVLYGHPYKECLDACVVISNGQVFLRLFVFSLIIFLPAYYSLCRYYVWFRNYKI